MTLYFFREYEDNGYLSNWYLCETKIPFDEYLFETSEHVFMYLKAKCFGDITTARKIVTCKTARGVKALGQQVKNFDESVWEACREEAMIAALKAKFESNDHLRAKLKATRKDVLVEASPYDRIWGIGISVADAKKGIKWKGLNLLGKCLMKVREDI